MEKILNFSFKFGKTFSSILLVLLCILILISGFNCLKNLIPTKNIYPKFSDMVADATAIKNEETTKDVTDKKAKKYILIINEIVKENDLNETGKEIIFENVSNVEEEERNTYSKNLKPFVADYYSHMKKKNLQVSGNDFYNILEEYQSNYFLYAKVKAVNESTRTTKLIVYSSILLSSILLFMLCLLLPLLIKIEENTRK